MKIYNTLTRKKEEFVPIDKNEVKMYSCGPTVYDYFHIGNARPFIVFDTMRRYLEYSGYKVKFVQNFTDIDDKMIRRANEEGITVKELGERFIKEYFEDAHALGIHEATVHPKATENIDAIIKVVQSLVEKGYAYAVDGNVYFSTKKFKEYGKLSHQPLDELEAGARIDINEHKNDPMDFALWKAQKPGEPAWESPWGMGRPGWHIECSAMVNKFLGETIDIHSGGQDLIFPHHENEIAQSECANGKPFAHYWMHNGYININNQKMSKSLGNFFTVYTCLDNLAFLAQNSAEKDLCEKCSAISAKLDECREKFIAAMDDDLNTADAIAAIFDIVYLANTEITADCAKQVITKAIDLIHELGAVLGLFTKSEKKTLDEEVEELIEKRNKARIEKNWAEADAIRDKLKEMNIILKDTPNGVQWSIAE